MNKIEEYIDCCFLNIANIIRQHLNEQIERGSMPCICENEIENLVQKGLINARREIKKRYGDI